MKENAALIMHLPVAQRSMQLHDDLFLLCRYVSSLQISSQIVNPSQSATLPTPQ